MKTTNFGGIICHILEWNEGRHFNESEERIDKGIKWTIRVRTL